MKRLSVNAAAKRAGVSRRQINNALALGELRFLRLTGGGVRIAPADLDRWVAAKSYGRGVAA